MTRFQGLLDELGVHVAPELYELALVHRSYAYENGGIPTNERLEFLGDSVLGIVVTDYLYRRFPDHPEGRLAKLRASVVSSVSLGEVARSLEIGPHIMLGHGETLSGGHDKTSILADTTEALLGAVYLSSGIEGASVLIHHLFDPLVERAEGLGAGLDWKTSLQEICAEQGLPMPIYEVEESGPDHDKRFTAHAVIEGHTFDPGHGTNKKQAEQIAAESAFQWLHDHAERDTAADSTPA